ncbi:MAG: SRPBCC family protein [Ktedonobacteraceae bacterium]|nr:SRPBCC family protein [Ktedonobacteraceae bacterium]
MSHISVTSERVIAVRPDHIYRVLVDYKHKRPKMLPPDFVDYAVEKGGKGPGTEVRYRLQAGGRERSYHMHVEEPVKGRVITERDCKSSLVTTWRLAPLDGGEQTRVSVTSEWEGGQGVQGFFERTFAPFGLSRIYQSMLTMLMLMTQPAGRNLVDAREEEEKKRARRMQMLPLAMLGVAAVAVILGYRRWQNG